MALCNTDAGLNARDAERFALRSWRHRGWNGDCLTRDMAKALGCKRWAIAEGYLPPDDESKARELVSHEAACILNASDEDAHVEVMIHFTDREPIGPYRVTVLARRTLHLRFNDLDTPEPIPRGTDYSSVIESDVPIVVQHTRLDSRVGLALLSTLAFAAS